MNLIWTQNLTDKEEIKKFRQSVSNSIVLDRLNEVLEDMKKENERTELSKAAYDNPNWAYQQAHRNGYVACLNQILYLTNPDQRKNDTPNDRQSI